VAIKASLAKAREMKDMMSAGIECLGLRLCKNNAVHLTGAGTDKQVDGLGPIS
jgi:hypothetical protein